MASRILWNYYRDEIDDLNVSDNASDGKLFIKKTKIVGETPEIPLQSGKPGNADQPPQLSVPYLNVEVTIPTECLSNF